MEAYFLIPGKPIAKKRPRFARRGKFVTTYNDQETEEGRVLWEIKQQWKESPIEGPISISFGFFLPFPASASKKNVEKMLSGMIRATKRPDIDNYAKFYLDCLNQVVFKDDSQIWKIGAAKAYAKEPRTVIFLEWES